VSADNWAACPSCAKAHDAEIAALDAAIADAYGKVSVAEFDQMRADRDEFVRTPMEATFREDYEIWRLQHCDQCGASKRILERRWDR
jgi:hypothetical protein